MLKYLSWVIPQNFLLFADDTNTGGAGGKDEEEDPDQHLEDQEPGEDQDVVDEITDETVLHTLDTEALDAIIDREDVDMDKFLNWVKTGKDEKVKFADIKAAPEEPEEKVDDPDLDESDQDEEKPDEDDIEDEEIDDEGEGDQSAADDKPDAADDKSDKTDKKNPKPEKPITVNDDYINKQVNNLKDSLKDRDQETINKQSEQLQKILEGIKGDQMSSRALKNYINGQMYIKTIKSPFDEDWKPDPKITQDPKYIEKAQSQKNQMITDRVKKKYPDFPDDALENPEALRDFERDLNAEDPSSYQEYRDLYKSESKDINDSYDRYVYLTENWENVAKDTIDAEVTLFENWLKDKGVSTKDLGIESLKLNDDFYNEYLWKNVLFDPKEKPNSEVLQFLDGVIPVVKPTTVFNKLKDLTVDEVIKAREHKARTEAYNKGIKDQPDPALSDSPQTPGQREEIALDEEKIFDDDNASIEDHDKALSKIKNKILGKKR